jgi:hypothetical protein
VKTCDKVKASERSGKNAEKSETDSYNKYNHEVDP